MDYRINDFSSSECCWYPLWSWTCFYELFIVDHFDKPVLTPKFKLNLADAKLTSTDHDALKRRIRFNYNPATIDGKRLTHLNFSLTYDGAHTGAVVPMTEGVHIMAIARDSSDLVGGVLNCNVEIN